MSRKQTDFERGYRCALRHVAGLRKQYWSDDALPEVKKLFAQIRNCLVREAPTAEVREERRCRNVKESR